MLVLTRKVKESIAIGDHVKITVLSIKGSQVQLGIEAPTHIGVYREEISARIAAENRSAKPKSQDNGLVVPAVLGLKGTKEE